MFDKEIFRQLVEIAIGDRTTTEYANDSGVNRTYISKYLNKRLDTPPSPEVLKKLADSAKNNITYEDFMEASGYIKKNDSTTSKIETLEQDQFADDLIKILVESGEMKEGEVLTDEKRERLLNLVKKAIEISRL